MSPTVVTQHNVHHGDLAHPSRPAVDNAFIEDRLCPGCKKSAVTEHGGLVVAFGQSFFHVDCFKCAKCGDQVNADTNLLLLSDGSPICANCSYSCNVCHLPILDEAIMTGDDSYHAHCFKCKVCDTRIDELVFAKTSHGIYCMNCHNKRMIRLREHAQRKAERAKEKAAANGAGLVKPRERDAKENSIPFSGFQAPFQTSGRNSLSTRTSSMPHDAYVGDTFTNSTIQSFNVTVAPPSDKTSDNNRSSTQSGIPALNTPSHGDIDARRRSYDDGVRPLNVLFGGKPSGAASISPRSDKRLSTSPSLSPTDSRPFADAVPVHSPESQDSLTPSVSRRDKRRSINPTISLSELGVSPTSSNVSPRSPNIHLPVGRMHVPPSPGGLSSHGSSPYQEISHLKSPTLSNYGSSLTVRPESRNARPSEEYQRPSRPETPARLSEDSSNQTIVVRSPPLINLGSVPPSKLRLKTNTSNGSSRDRIDRPSTSTGYSDLRKREDHDRYEPRPHSSSLSLRSLGPSRSGSLSPAYRADVPSGIESGSETDEEAQNRVQSPDSTTALEAKEDSTLSLQTRGPSNGYPETESSLASPDSDDLAESPTAPLQRISHSTYIAPALPPIRLSMTAADFSELLNSVGGFPSIKSLDQLAQIAEAPQNPVKVDDLTPKNGSPAIPTAPLSTTLGVPPKPTSRAPAVFARRPSESVASKSSSESSLTLNGSPHDTATLTCITLTEPESSIQRALNGDSGDAVLVRLRENLNDARERGMQQLNIDRTFVEVVLSALETTRADHERLRSKFDGVKRTSKLYSDGLTVAQGEYDRELKARRDAEAEVTRLRVLLSGQVARLTAMSGETRREELRQQISKEHYANLRRLEQDLSNIKAERDMALAEVEELSASRSDVITSPELPSAILSRSLAKRFDNIRAQYRAELVPLTKEKESLSREIVELKAVRDAFLEETTMLNARNEELAQLSAVYSRRMETVPETATINPSDTFRGSLDRYRPLPQNQHDVPLPPPLSSSTSASSTIYEDGSLDNRYVKAHGHGHGIDQPTPAKKFMKWPGSKSKEILSAPTHSDKKAVLEHNFQQLSVLRFTRCDHCGDKMWGSQLRCTVCPTSIHVRCITHVQLPCVRPSDSVAGSIESPPGTLPPSMFGRDLVEQVYADARDGNRQVPVIVEKCIDAVEALAMDYEGIYRKSGGSGQSKLITQLFERGDYKSFDLRDQERFNDICSITSVLKNYFRQLPVPLLTFDFHNDFMAAIHGKDPSIKHTMLQDLVNKLPNEHYYTLKMLMLHLHRIHERCETNLMTARNLGVVFGPTLMRSRDPSAEFSDMAGKALSIEWLIENASSIFHSR